jgi:hypothetical protein
LLIALPLPGKQVEPPAWAGRLLYLDYSILDGEAKKSPTVACVG